MKNMKEMMHHAKLKKNTNASYNCLIHQIYKKKKNFDICKNVKFNALQKWAYFLFWF